MKYLLNVKNNVTMQQPGKPSDTWLMLPILTMLIISVYLNLCIDSDSLRESYWTNQQELFLYFNHLFSRIPDAFWANITLMGEVEVLLPIIFFLSYKYRYHFWGNIFCSIPLSSFLSFSLKRLFAVPRPATVLDPEKIHFIGEILVGYKSLPSGHTITISTVIVTIIISIIHYFGTVKKSKGIIMFVAFFGTIIALSRIAVGAHWPLDVLLGIGCGCLSGLSGASINNKYYEKISQYMQIKSRVLGVTFMSLMFVNIYTIEHFNIIIIWLSLFSGIVVSCMLYVNNQLGIK